MQQYVKGEFQTFRTITKIHLGALSDNLHEGEEVEFDGFTMRRGGETHPLHSLRGAIKAGWLIPQDAPDARYVPKPAGVVVHKADGVNEGAVEINVEVNAENDNVGSISSVRPEGAPATHRATNAGERSGDSDGEVVARFKTSAKQGAVTVGKDDRRVVQSLDNKSSVEVERVKVARAVATGDVQEAIGGESLEELLPEAASAGTPEPGVVGTSDSEAISEYDSRLELIRQFIPGFEWDLSVQWRKRAKAAVDQYGKIPAVMDYILSVETDSVKKEIEKRMGSR